MVGANRDTISIASCKNKIIPDDFAVIVNGTTLWSTPDDDASTMAPYNLIFTTGGIGFSPRDVTPEATATVLDYECKSLMVWVSNECAKKQPLAPLSRGIAGICEGALLSNLLGTGNDNIFCCKCYSRFVAHKM